MQECNPNYSIRGVRVEALNSEIIKFQAYIASKLLNINRNTRNNMGLFMESLHVHGISLDVVEDSEWYGIADAICHNGVILVPNELYLRICKGEDEAIFIFLHELGHLILGHKAMLHHCDSPPTQYEDSEWQADEFSKNIMEIMKLNYIPEQLRLPF